ncbi:MAG: flavodoxin domain-containing protein [Candidatus Heimdallarchaeota archaeon]|nr:MAG: hypothetical protein DRP02_02635 [Candidatus Gerdarchaeota archaeon]
MTKVAIIFGTRKGMTRKSAEIIADILKTKFKLDIALFNAKKAKLKDILEEYENLIIGSGIAMGFWVRTVKKIVQKKDFTNKKVALFVCSGLAGDALKANDKEEHQKVISKYIDRVIAKNPSLQPLAKTAFGGRWVRKNGEQIVDNWKKEDVENWAEAIGKLFQ